MFLRLLCLLVAIVRTAPTTLAFEGIAPLHAARTSQRDVPTRLNRYETVGCSRTFLWDSTHTKRGEHVCAFKEKCRAPRPEVHLQVVGAFNAPTPDRGCVEDQPQRPGR